MNIPHSTLAAQLHETTNRYDAHVQMLVVHTLGAAVVAAAQEEEEVTFRSLMALSDEEYAAWRLMHDDAPPATEPSSNSNKVALAHSLLTQQAQQLFGTIGNYGLGYAVPSSLQLEAMPSPAVAIHHELTAESRDGLALLVRKTSHSGDHKRQELLVARHDYALVALAVQRLGHITMLLTEPGELQ